MNCAPRPQSFEVKQADELLTAEFEAKWRDRRALDPFAQAALRAILERFIGRDGPVKVEKVAALLPGHDPGEVSAAIALLDEKDLILVQDGQVTVAYPFAAAPTAFQVVLPNGHARYAVCAIDALGVPAMLGRRVTIHSRCHHCGEGLTIDARPDGPIGKTGIMVWVRERGDIRQKAFTSL